MSYKSEHFLKHLDKQIFSKHLLTSVFYQAWSRGELSMDCLKDYAKEYYHHVKAFPAYLSALHSHTEDAKTRRILLQNLIEEEAGEPNHPDLWKNFALSLGVTEVELAAHTPSLEIKALIQTFKDICKSGTVAEGIAALYAYESQVPEVSISKIDGLKKHYGLKNPKSFEYFSVHIEADKEHAAQERALLESYVKNDNQELIDVAVNKVLDRLQDFLSSMCHRYQIAC